MKTTTVALQPTLSREIQADILARYLKARAKNVRTGTLTLSGVNHLCASYEQDGQQRIYVIGERPAAYARSGKVAIRINGGADDWYVAAYMAHDRINSNNCDFHPLGANFLLCRWQVPSGEPIDAYHYWRGEKRNYRRLQASLRLDEEAP